VTDKLTKEEEAQIRSIPKLTDAAKDWLLSVASAREEGRYRDLDALLLYAARIISRFSL